MFCAQNSLPDAQDICQRPGGLGLTRRGLALCDFPPQANIVDVGCGTGASVRLLRKEGYCGIGLEKTVQACDIPQVQGLAEALPFTPDSLDGILCECVLSLLPEPAMILKNFYQVCRIGGHLLLSDLYRKNNESSSSGGLFSRQKMETALQDAGWQVTFFEDHSPALKEYAANLLWYGRQAKDSWPPKICGEIAWRDCGYGLWIARKDVRTEAT